MPVSFPHISFFLMLILLSACSDGNGLLLLPRTDAVKVTRPLAATAERSSRQQVKVRFFSVDNKGISEALSTENIARLTFDGQFSLDAEALRRQPKLSQDFNFLESGPHILELLFNSQEEPVQIPLVVPEGKTSESFFIVVNLAFNDQGKVRDVQVGYDQNEDLRLDTDKNIYRSSDGISFLTYLPDGQVKEWISPLTQLADEPLPGSINAPLPPGSERDANADSASAPVPQNAAASDAVETPQTPLPPVDVPPVPVPQPLPLPAPPA